MFLLASHPTGWLIKCILMSRSLITPEVPLNIQRHMMPIINPETAHGKKISP